jgi:hypothetical protein
MTPKIIELIIQDGDEQAGLDGIALVEMPAHEAKFEYFNEDTEPKQYVLKDEDIEPAIKLFSSFGEPQGLLESEGWVIQSVEKLGHQSFAIISEPNKNSPIRDTENTRVRFKYVGPQDEKNRPFCADMMQLRRVFRYEDIMEMSTLNVNPIGPSGYSIMEWRGSYNCRHGWVKLVYAKEGTIINNAKVSKGVISQEDVPGPDTRTDATIAAGNTPPRSFNATNPDVSALSPYVDQITDDLEKKPVLAADEGNMNVLGYSTKHFDICPVALQLFQHLITHTMDDDTEGMIRSAAQIADNVFGIEKLVIEKNEATREELVEATLLVNDFVDLMGEIDEEVGMVHDTTFMQGHLDKIESYVSTELGLEEACWEGYEPIGMKEKDGKLVPNCVPIEAAMEKFRQEFQSYNDYPESARNNACKAIKWKEKYGNEVKGMTQIGWIRANQLCKGEKISEETISRMSGFQRHKKNSEVAPELKDTPWKDAGYVAWLGWGGTTGVSWASDKLSSLRGQMSFSVMNAEERMLVGPAMVPDKMIIRRNDITGDIYYVYFTAETIKKLQQKFMQEKLLDATNIEHGRKFLKNVDVVESWIVEDPVYDKQKTFGMDYPKGTWMVMMKVNDDEVWKKVKDGKLRGFSVQGYFLEKAKFNSQSHQLLEQIKNIVKDIR